MVVGWIGGFINGFRERSPYYESVEIPLPVAERAEKCHFETEFGQHWELTVCTNYASLYPPVHQQKVGTVVQPWWWITLFFSRATSV